MAKDDIKALLIEDYRYRATGMAESEKSGETRINLFIGLITFCGTAIGAGYAKGSFQDVKQMHELALAAVLALLAVGIVILFRMAIRNENTDLAKHQLDLIRQAFKDHFDDSDALAGYDLFPKSDGRKFGGLTDLVAVINGVLVAGAVMFAFLIHSPGQVDNERLAAAAVVAVAAFFLAVWEQRRYIRRLRDDYKKRYEVHFNCTHAGGVVFSVEDGAPRYLIVRPSDAKKDEWVLPKGHIEKGEHPRAAAVREVEEEAGVIAAVVTELAPISLSLNVSGEPTRIRFYLMNKTGSVTRAKKTTKKKERRDPRWVSLGEALRMLSFKESRALLRRADQIVSK